MMGVGHIHDMQHGHLAITGHIGHIQPVPLQVHPVGNAQRVYGCHDGHAGLGNIGHDDALMGGRDKGKTTRNLDIARVTIRFDIANMVGCCQIVNVDDLNAAITIRHKCQSICGCQAIRFLIGQVNAPGQLVRQAELVITVLVIENQQLAGFVFRVETASFGRCINDAFQVVYESAGIARVVECKRGDIVRLTGFRRQHIVGVCVQRRYGAGKDFHGAQQQRVIDIDITRLVHFLWNVGEENTRARATVVGTGIPRGHAQSFVLANWIQSGPGTNHSAGTTRTAVLIHVRIEDQLGKLVRCGCGAHKAPLGYRCPNFVIGRLRSGLFRMTCDLHFDIDPDPFVALRRALQNMVIGESGPINEIVVVWIADWNGRPCGTCLIVPEQFDGALIERLPATRVVLIFP